MSCKKAANVTGAKLKTPVIPVTTPKPAPPPAATTPPSATIPAMSSAPIVNYPLYPTIMIETTDNQVVEVSMFPLAKHSPVIRKMLYAYCSNPKRIDPVLRLDPAFDTATLLKVIEWCDHYRHWDPAVPLELAEISEWDANFLRMDMKSLLEVVKASYYLEIDGLGDVTCHGLAQLMEGKSPQQLREMFNIVNDFRGDEEANARGCTGTGGCSHTRASRGTNTIPAGATGVTSTAAKSAPHAASKQSRKQMRASQRSKASCAVQAGAPCKGTACSVRSP